MSIENAPASEELTGSVLFYSKPEPLNLQKHSKYGVKRSDKPFAFAATAHIVPLTVAEFESASKCFPIIFIGDDYQPAAVMGLRAEENLFIETNGDFDVETYIPAFIRRVPFVFANDTGSDNMILCIDAASPIVDAKGGDVPLFVDGQLSPYTEGALNFCKEFETERQRSEVFLKLVKELDVFEKKQVNFQPPPGPDGVVPPVQVLADYMGVSEEKLNKLPDAKLGELVRNGVLSRLHLHLASLSNWERLIGRALRRQEVAANA